MSAVTKPQGRISLGWATIGGQRVPVAVDIEWDRFLELLVTQSNSYADSALVGVQGMVGVSVMSMDFDSSDIEFIFGLPGLPADIELATTITATTVVTARSGTILVDTTAGNVTVTLPANGLVYRIKRITGGANTLTIATASGNIDNAATASLAIQYESVTLKSDGTDFWVV